MLDVISGGRCLFGFGRGAARIEYDGFHIPMDEARPRFKEGLDDLVCEFGYGGLPHHEAQLNMRLFADKVMPVLQRDKLFTQPPEIITAPPVPRDEGVFVPA